MDCTPENQETGVTELGFLLRIITLTLGIKDTFINREDCLISTDVSFGITDKKFGPAEDEESRNPRKILSITERYSLPAEAEPKKSIAERIYDLEMERIKLKFHREKDRILCQVRNKKGVLITIILSSSLSTSSSQYSPSPLSWNFFLIGPT